MVRIDPQTLDKLRGKDFVRPRMKVAGYHLRWNTGVGIPETEVKDLRDFLRDAIPFLRVVLDVVQFVQADIERRAGRTTHEVERSFSPTIRLTHARGAEYQYHLLLAWDGSVFLDREEEVFIRDSKNPERLDFAGISITQFIAVLERATLV